MDTFVFLAVLGAALCHATWNAGLKLRVDPGVALTILALAGAAVSLPLLLVTGWPAAVAWPYLAASALVHVVYFLSLAEAYRHGDLSQVYPIARGVAPLLTTVGSIAILAEPVGARGLLGITLLVGGVLLLAMPRERSKHAVDLRAIGFALITALMIATYTLIDGRGAQVSGDAHAYTVAFFVLNGLVMGAVRLVRQRPELFAAFRTVGLLAPLGGGVLSVVSYWVALWAMTKAPIALVAALRETSVLFAAALGVIWLKEPLRPERIAAALLVVAGLVMIRLG